MPTKETAGDATRIEHGSVPSESIKDQQTIERTLYISENLSLARGKSMPLIDTPPFGASLLATTAAVAALADEDLLDFADIFASGEPTPLRAMADEQMRRRGLSL